MVEEKRFAVLIDADNVSAKYVKYILDEISNYGVATYKRIYGDWTKPTAGAWKDVLLENSVTPVQQYSYTVGKNATDSAMIIDAMDILYSGYVEGFCIVSSDSDFTKLSSRLRESGMYVVGMGEKKTPKPFIASCNVFKYLDILAEPENKNLELDSENGMAELEVIKQVIIKLLNETDVDDRGINMADLGNYLVKRYPDFDVRNYGDTKLSKFLKKFDCFDIETKEGTTMWVTLRLNSSPNTNIGKKTTEKRPGRRNSRRV